MALKSERQKELETAYYFLCNCPKCLTPEPLEMTGSACPNTKCDNCIDIENTKVGQPCSKCLTLLSEEFVTEFREIVKMTQMHLNNMRETTCILLF